MTISRHFPDYPASRIPQLPEGFEDSTTRIDAIPSYQRGRIRILIDHPEAERSYYPEPPQEEHRPFLVLYDDHDRETLIELHQGADWNDAAMRAVLFARLVEEWESWSTRLWKRDGEVDGALLMETDIDVDLLFGNWASGTADSARLDAVMSAIIQRANPHQVPA